MLVVKKKMEKTKGQSEGIYFVQIKAAEQRKNNTLLLVGLRPRISQSIDTVEKLSFAFLSSKAKI